MSSSENLKSRSHFWTHICEEPYRILFPLGILFGILGVGHWILYGAGAIPSYSMYYHSSLQSQTYLLCFILGFLLTAMPKFTQSKPASRGELWTFVALIFAIFIFYSIEMPVFAVISYAVVLLRFGLFAVTRLLSRDRTAQPAAGPPPEFVWLPIAVAHGIVGSVLMGLGMLGSSSLVRVGKPMMEQGFILAIVLGIGGFLVPRLMGRFVPHTLESDSSRDRIKKKRIFFHLIMGASLFMSFWMEGSGAQIPAQYLRAVIVTAEMFFNRILPAPPRVPDLFIKLIWISMWCVFVGNWAAAVLPKMKTVMLHLVFIGGYSLMIFGVATMVVLSHSGHGSLLRKPLAILRLAGFCLLAVVITRIGGAFFPESYFNWITVAASLWIAASLGWFFFTLPRLMRFPDPGSFERMHDEAKKRIMDAAECSQSCSEKGRKRS